LSGQPSLQLTGSRHRLMELRYSANNCDQTSWNAKLPLDAFDLSDGGDHVHGHRPPLLIQFRVHVFKKFARFIKKRSAGCAGEEDKRWHYNIE
jgi:hypothetical protein